MAQPLNIVVTGSASGIGRRLVTLLAEAGHHVLATDVDVASLPRATAECRWPAERVTTSRLDVTDAVNWSDVMAQAVARFQRLDALINVAGVLKVESVLELRPESVAIQLDVNTKGVILGTHAAAKVMIGQRRGRIVNVASMAALAPVPGISIYSASKFAVRGFSLAADQELSGDGIRVSVVCPDAVDTPMVDYQLDHAGAALTFSGGRILTADEVARAIVGLLNGKHRAELVIPWNRGFLARISNILPTSIHRWISRRLTQRGLARQEQLRSRRAETAART